MLVDQVDYLVLALISFAEGGPQGFNLGVIKKTEDGATCYEASDQGGDVSIEALATFLAQMAWIDGGQVLV